MDGRDIVGRNAAHLNTLSTASSPVASPAPEQTNAPPAGRRATSGALAPLSELRAQRAVRGASSSASSGDRHDIFDIRRTPSDELFRLGESIRLRTAASASAAAAASQSRPSAAHGDGPARPHTCAQPLGQPMRPDGRPSAPDAGHASQPSGSADFYFTHDGPLTESDRLPYRLLEALHQDLFSSPEIRQVASRRGLPIGKVLDVDLNEFEAINATAGEREHAQCRRDAQPHLFLAAEFVPERLASCLGDASAGS